MTAEMIRILKRIDELEAKLDRLLFMISQIPTYPTYHKYYPAIDGSGSNMSEAEVKFKKHYTVEGTTTDREHNKR